jgi:dCMP deaminase
MSILSERWQHYYINLAEQVGTGSKDGSSKFGAILVRPDKTVASIGFNGFPARLKDVHEFLNDPDFRHEKYPRIVHAEVNCLNYNRDYDTRGFHMFVSAHPCDKCALRIASTGIDYVYYVERPDFDSRWSDSLAMAKTILADAGITLIRVDLEAAS